MARIKTDKPLTPFQQALIAIGKTDDERAAVLGVCGNTVLAWRNGKAAPKIANLIKHPDLLAAYLESLAPSARAAA